MLGGIQLQLIDPENANAEIGYGLLPHARGHGYAAEALRQVTEWSFATLALERIGLMHAVENEASCRVAEQAGYRLEGTLRKSHRFGDGTAARRARPRTTAERRLTDGFPLLRLGKRQVTLSDPGGRVAPMTDAARTICDQVADIGDRVAALLAAVVSTPRVAPCGGPEGLPTDDRLRALLVGLEAVRNATEAAQAEAMAAMAREAQALDRSESASGMRGHSHEEFTSDEIAALLSCTTVAAAHRYETACRVAALHPVRHAWRTGRIDEPEGCTDL